MEKYFPRLWGTGISDAIFYNDFLYLDAQLDFDKHDEEFTICSSDVQYRLMPIVTLHTYFKNS